MNTKILEQLTFGFEIEGEFKKGLALLLKGRGNFKSDGSVSREDKFPEYEIIPLVTPESCTNCVFQGTALLRYCPAHHANYNREGQPSSEYSSGVFENLSDCLSDLTAFNKSNHAWNYSAGLHFHVGIRNAKHHKLFGIASNYEYLTTLYKQAMKWCEHQNKRLNNQERTRYYRFWPNAKALVSNTKSSSKYDFVRFHAGFNTLEFRFLSPCECKVDNIRNLVESLTDYLGEDKVVKVSAEAEYSKIKHKKVTKEYGFTKSIKLKTNVVKKLFQPDTYRPEAKHTSGFLTENQRRTYQAERDSLLTIIYGLLRNNLLRRTDWQNAIHRLGNLLTESNDPIVLNHYFETEFMRYGLRQGMIGLTANSDILIRLAFINGKLNSYNENRNHYIPNKTLEPNISRFGSFTAPSSIRTPRPRSFLDELTF